MIWLLSGGPEDPVNDTVIEQHGAEAVHSALKSLMHAIRPDDNVAQQDAAHQMKKTPKP